MAIAVDNGPAVAELYEIGWRECRRVYDDNKLVVRNGFSLNHAEHGRKRFKIYKRSEWETEQYWYGIQSEQFKYIDFNLFWAWDQDYFLLVPTCFLQEKLQMMPRPRWADRRWSVNIYFDESGESILKPVHWKKQNLGRYPRLTQFRHPSLHSE